VTPPVHVIGSYLSPYVRKVLVFLHEKGVPYDIDPIVPFYGDDRFSRLSPVRRIPVLIDDRVTLCDSSVICQYLEERHPQPALYPTDVSDRARARWLEEYADTRMGEVFIWRLFNQVAIRRAVWGEETDASVVEKTLREDVPDVLDYLESELPAEGFVFGAFSIADVSLASFFRNAALARFSIDAARWPRTSGLVARVLARESFARLAPFEHASARAPIPKHREALAAIGAPLASETYFSDRPRRGVLSI
jgi:glutathione S-transferase